MKQVSSEKHENKKTVVSYRNESISYWREYGVCIKIVEKLFGPL